MESLIIKIVARLLQHHSITFAFVGEIALNYYNVPRVRHDIEVCVPSPLLQVTADMLLATGLFQRSDPDSFNLYSEYKRGMPRLSTTGWLAPTQFVCLFPDEFFHLEPLEKSLVAWEQPASPGREPCYYISEHMLDTDGLRASDIRSLSLPRLSRLLVGFARRYLDQKDDTAMIAAEQLVDGMDVDESWCARHLRGESQSVISLIRGLVQGKASRLDDFSDYHVTCFLKDEAVARLVRGIPGYD
ncbi:hypothetical protein F503_02928 [Ophiostoma piceae UAMH 11346]|uniref:Uncharacterized protein n=1 Tax=Ophiostoma piceae (strain UAMH 11346) TaxID=1262450 RepID=S3BXY0_OPHP1|nr:hypothetical protein F503_02928 [Ophiostoma piceae UAMH 11346]